MIGEAERADPERFRLAARSWLAGHMPLLPEGLDNQMLSRQDENGQRARELQQRLFAGGFAGLCFPRPYGGQGLSHRHQQVFTEESRPYEMPALLNVPTLAILAPTILDFGTEEQKSRHVRGILAGEEIWVQMLSEPTNGSDLAGVTTRATRDGDVFVLSGSKIWTSGAFRADYALCLARTDWQAPKHRGLTMFIVPIHQPRIEVHRIRRVNGNSEFCQEFLNDVEVPETDVLGRVDDGWAVAGALLNYEREAAGNASPLISEFEGGADDAGRLVDLLELVRGQPALDRRSRALVAEAMAAEVVHGQLAERATAAVRDGAWPAAAGSLVRLMAAVNAERRADIGLELAGAGAGTAPGPGSRTLDWSQHYLYRQGGSLAGGSNEMQRNLISERVLGMPREFAPDVGVPFDQVRHNELGEAKADR